MAVKIRRSWRNDWNESRRVAKLGVHLENHSHLLDRAQNPVLPLVWLYLRPLCSLRDGVLVRPDSLALVRDSRPLCGGFCDSIVVIRHHDSLCVRKEGIADDLVMLETELSTFRATEASSARMPAPDTRALVCILAPASMRSELGPKGTAIGSLILAETRHCRLHRCAQLREVYWLHEMGHEAALSRSL